MRSFENFSSYLIAHTMPKFGLLEFFFSFDCHNWILSKFAYKIWTIFHWQRELFNLFFFFFNIWEDLLNELNYEFFIVTIGEKSLANSCNGADWILVLARSGWRACYFLRLSWSIAEIQNFYTLNKIIFISVCKLLWCNHSIH